MLSEGWSDIDIPIEDIENGPRGRQLDLSYVKAVNIFAVSLKEARVIYIDNLQLKKR